MFLLSRVLLPLHCTYVCSLLTTPLYTKQSSQPLWRRGRKRRSSLRSKCEAKRIASCNMIRIVNCGNLRTGKKKYSSYSFSELLMLNGKIHYMFAVTSTRGKSLCINNRHSFHLYKTIWHDSQLLLPNHLATNGQSLCYQVLKFECFSLSTRDCFFAQCVCAR